jgi:PAS domain S-box-containing protein
MATILIVDDLPTNREFLVTLLQYQGHRLVEAADGIEGLEAARREPPDLVITDVLMPGMDGYELLRQLRLDSATAGIPIIFYTAHYGEREARELALSAGVSSVLTKPAEPEAVLKMVALALRGASPPEPIREPDTFDREHLRLVTDKLSANVDELRGANARLRALVNIGLGLASERDVSRLLDAVVESAHELFSASTVTLAVFGQNGAHVAEHVATTAHGAAWTANVPRPSGLLAGVMANRHVVRAHNPSGDPAAIGLPAAHPRVVTYLAAPVSSPTHVYGWICLGNQQPTAFTDEDEQLVTALAGLVGRVYANGYLYRLAERRADAVERAEERTRFLLQAAKVGTWDHDYVNDTLVLSDVLQQMLGLAPGTFVGTMAAFIERVHPEDRHRLIDNIRRAATTNGAYSVEIRTNPSHGTIRWLAGAGHVIVDAGGRPLRVTGVAVDETERKSLEAQYLQSQKMEAMGRLAGGVAHDFNNLLGAILGYSELMIDDLPDGDAQIPDLVAIQQAATTATGLTRQLLAFSRKQILELTLLDLSDVVSRMRDMLQRLLGEDVHVVLALDHGLPTVKMDRTQVEQIIMNLAVNARDAMPQGGTLTIGTRRVAGDQPLVALELSDTGTGIAPEIRDHIFEPFFTTKEAGKGTGLGLATVFGIATQNGGRVEVSSDVGQGTTFTVYLPAVESAATPPAVAAVPPPDIRGTETVLVVEDNAGMRDIARRFLAKLGYTVLIAGSAREALSLSARSGHIDVVLTDVVMPGGSGPEMAAEMLRAHPGLKVLYMSGHTEESIVDRGVLKPGIAFVQKPFTQDAVGRKLREVLRAG